MELGGWGAGMLVKTKGSLGREGQQCGTTFWSCEPEGLLLASI